MLSRDSTGQNGSPNASTVNRIKAQLNNTGPGSWANGGISGPVEKPTDDTSIAPTTSLIKMFEQNAPKPTSAADEASKPVPKPKPFDVSRRSAAPQIKSPKPQRPFVVLQTPSTSSYGRDNRFGGDGVKVDYPERGEHSRKDADDAPTPVEKTAPTLTLSRTSSVPLQATQDGKAKPDLPPPRRSNKITLDATDEVSPPPRSSTQHLEPTKRPLPPRNPNSYHAQNLRQLQPHLTGDTLANAMVGAALASS
ncbi:hypothetical protein LTS18_013862, partial [Coniosporium uncinatum]